MPLDRERKSALRDRVSLANKTTAAEVIELVQAALDELEDGDKDKARLEGWIEDLTVVRDGGNPGKF
ncbi:MAG TPA: hypothetical protein PKE32_05595 [Miltoncostaeaceae bacterium]|nr:hypothetical protein [Miltoncostaeaceae bacterium]